MEMSERKTIKIDKTGMIALMLTFVLCMGGCGGDSAAQEQEAPAASGLQLEEIPEEDPVQALGTEMGTDGTKEAGPRTEEGDAAGTGDKETETEEGAVQNSTTVDSAAPVISWEILRSVKEDASGKEIAYAEYPVFTVSGEEYGALVSAIDVVNEEYQAWSGEFLATAEENGGEDMPIRSQSSQVNITRCDGQAVSIVILRSVEAGGPHPDNYFETYNFNPQTGEALNLSEFMTVDEAVKETIEKQLYENYPELDFDKTTVRQEISDALSQNTVTWYFQGDRICIDFKEGSFGFGHAEGSLGVVL